MKVARTEDKYVISQKEYMNLRGMLSAIMNRDQGGSYWIRSLYFDNPYDKDYKDKIIGDNIRKKIRLRIYSIEDTKVKLEIKNKEGKFSEKETVTLTREDALKMVSGDFDFLRQYGLPTSNKVYMYSKKDLLLPKVLIDYRREAFYLDVNDVRITFDYDIRASKSTELFCDINNSIRLHDADKLVMEVKYNHYLPDVISRLISSVSPTQVSVSKYGMARTILW